MRVLIFTEGGSQIGLGHISRCSSLYDELEDRGIEVELIIFADTSHFEMIENKKYKVVNWLSADFLTKYIKQSDYCIVDSYLASEDLYRVISNHAIQSLFIDDNGRIEYPKGIVVNPSLSTKALNYPKNDDTNCYLLGSNYTILRKPFIQVTRGSVNSQVKEVLITLGGSDIQNVTPRIIKQLSSKNTEIIFNIVIGHAFKNSDEIKKHSSKNINFYENATAEEMKSIMLKSDVAITAAGQTIYELIATQTPFIPISVIENQHYNILTLRELHLVETVLQYNDPLFNEKLIFEFDKIKALSTRVELVNQYQKVIDGLGSKRIIDALISNIMEGNYFLRKVKEEDIVDAFQLSNEDYVRKYSINTKKIDWEDHKIWFANIIKSNNHIFYVVTNNTDGFLGQLRFEIEDESATVSISLCKSIMGKGLSEKLIIKSIERIREERKELKKIIAFVSNENVASKKLFENAGFVLTETNNRMLRYSYSINRGV